MKPDRPSPAYASTTCVSSSATPGSRPTSIATRSASTWSPTPAWKRRLKHEAGYVLRQGDITFVLASPLGRDHPEQPAADASTATASRTSPSKWTTSSAPIETAVSRGAVGVCRTERCWKTSTASTNTPRSAPTATRLTPSSTATAIAASSLPATSRSTRIATARATFQPVGLQGHRPHRRQRRGRQDGRMGRVLQRSDGLRAARAASTTRTSAPNTRR